ncbi:uncharacterized protein BT62DRAFT_923480 [Guyanagaster necrorhizus]|uniref:Uncharacterized protein n=1 Tax=Guyanagaster necrorhizus TaxID=856835 RepID=A0A9P8AN07_9AGAR|nr:uncharacterized protein BT62DRAFT_923480 [Guyanagaster necrorhizus MCA 3950]KAG7441261.1 hypothetical protein BT62DRAFT_923480 [Guyanagaster necrorhizus MCA 3950]
MPWNPKHFRLPTAYDEKGDLLRPDSDQIPYQPILALDMRNDSGGSTRCSGILSRVHILGTQISGGDPKEVTRVERLRTPATFTGILFVPVFLSGFTTYAGQLIAALRFDSEDKLILRGTGNQGTMRGC